MEFKFLCPYPHSWLCWKYESWQESGFLWFAGQQVEIFHTHHHLCLCRGHPHDGHQPGEKSIGDGACYKSVRVKSDTVTDTMLIITVLYILGFTFDRCPGRDWWPSVGLLSAEPDNWRKTPPTPCSWTEAWAFSPIHTLAYTHTYTKQTY